MTGYATRRLAARHRHTPLLARTTLACAISTLSLSLSLAPAPALAQENSGTPAPVTQILPQVDATEQPEPGTSAIISGDELNRANSMKDVVRNQPLVSAPGTAAGRQQTGGGDQPRRLQQLGGPS